MSSTMNDRIDGVTTSVAVKAPCRVAALANISLYGTQTINGVAVAADDRVLVIGQTDKTENGIYVVSSTTWLRAADFDGARDVRKGTIVLVAEGLSGGRAFAVTSENPISINTSGIEFESAPTFSGDEVAISISDYTAVRLLSSPLVSSRVLCVEGRASNNDGGQGVFIYDPSDTTSADNGGTVLVDASGRRWKRYYFGRASLKWWCAVDGTTNDRTGFLAALAARVPLSLDGVCNLGAGTIDLDPYIISQTLGVDIEGNGPQSAKLQFSDYTGGFVASSFFRVLGLRKLSIRNNGMDKRGIGFRNPPGAEMVTLDDVNFEGWRTGCALHAWNSKISTITGRSCGLAFALLGTSTTIGAVYAIQCDIGTAFGYTVKTDVAVSDAAYGSEILSVDFALGYSSIGSVAADECGLPYKFGRCQGLALDAIGAEKSTGNYIFDLNDVEISSLQLVTIKTLSLYVQAADGTTVMFRTPSNLAQTFVIDDARIYSDKAIPIFSGNGNGVVITNLRGNTAANRPLFATTPTSGVEIDDTHFGDDNSGLSKTGVYLGGFNNVRRRIGAVTISGTQKLRFRIADTAVGDLASGVLFAGQINVLPVDKTANNASRESGAVIASTAADFAGGLASVAVQKVGNLPTFTCATAVSGTVTEVVLGFSGAAATYLLTFDVYMSCLHNTDHRDFYVS